LHLQLATQHFRLLTVGEKSIVDYEIANPVGSICFAKWYYEFVSVGHNRLQSYIFSVNSNTLRPQNVGAKVVFSGFLRCFSHSCVDFTLHLAECEQRIDAAGEKIGSPPAQVLMRREKQAKGAQKPVDFRAKGVGFCTKPPSFFEKVRSFSQRDALSA